VQAYPGLRYAFDAANASPVGPTTGPVSVLLGVRMADGSIVRAELRVPADRWPGVAVFTEYLPKVYPGARVSL